MAYAIKEIYTTLQGEGYHTGRTAVFTRFAGCNLWTGREEDRANAVCSFCDTDFVGVDGPNGGKFSSAEEAAKQIFNVWKDATGTDKPFVVCTGGEPLLQLDTALIHALHALEWDQAETLRWPSGGRADDRDGGRTHSVHRRRFQQ